MRLLFVNRYAYPDTSATAQMLTELTEELDRRGAVVTIVSGNAFYLDGAGPLAPHERYKGITIRRLQSLSVSRRLLRWRAVDCVLFYLLAAWTVMRLPRPDCLIVMSDPPLLSVPAAFLGWVKRCPSVCWLQDVFPDIAIRIRVLPDGLTTEWLRWLARWSMNRLDRTIVVGRCMQRHLASQGVQASRLTYIPNWADGARIHSLEPAAGNEFAVAHGLVGQFVVMYSGNFGLVHEVETLLGLLRVTASLERVVFCFVGHGARLHEIKEAVFREGWRHVRFLPFQSKAWLQWSLSAAHVHVITLRSDMTGLSVPSKLYGIMAAGRPVLFIGPETSETAMVIHEARCGYVVRPGDVRGAEQILRRVLGNDQELHAKGQAGRNYFDRYCDRPIAAAGFWRVLSEVVTKGVGTDGARGQHSSRMAFPRGTT